MGGMRASHKSRGFWVEAWVLRLVSMKETHWKTMRISGIKPLWKTMRILGISTDKHERTTLENHENIGNQYRHERTLLENHENIGNQYRVVRMKEPLWKTMRFSGISTDKHERTTLENHENIGNQNRSRESELRNILSILSLKEPGIKPGITTEAGTKF
ncbi:hypothetical protein DPMN_028359 [Dreissena polymorpha]|uniref:Uncharacterized protein n=1 Tax=Dreissena polymorpha TaxID=45954 RepID=A0A9D4RGE8_DREPO|nr:hypothetical protein DPMN_028359 [Dreissena polymorpha]